MFSQYGPWGWDTETRHVLLEPQLPADHPVQASVQGRLDRVMTLVDERLGLVPLLNVR